MSWRKIRIGDIATVVGGGTPSTKVASNFGGGIPWLTPRDLSRPHDRYVRGGERSLSQKGLDSSSARMVAAGAVVLSVRAPIDWTLRENVRAHLRRLVKRLLRKRGYPPDKRESATRTVLEQAEALSAAWISEDGPTELAVKGR